MHKLLATGSETQPCQDLSQSRPNKPWTWTRPMPPGSETIWDIPFILYQKTYTQGLTGRSFTQPLHQMETAFSTPSHSCSLAMRKEHSHLGPELHCWKSLAVQQKMGSLENHLSAQMHSIHLRSSAPTIAQWKQCMGYTSASSSKLPF